ncbi:MAG: Qat anti-phage system associated protein QatB [Bacteroidota bacterium]|nr:Qat anti-phage system associated protein QatB [Bacteroidota bacterium]
MGTSSSNTGPKKNTPLLPSWAMTDIDNNSDDESTEKGGIEEDNGDIAIDNSQKKEKENEIVKQNPQLTGNWGVAKGALTRYANKIDGSSIKKAAGSYVKAIGGAKKATKSAYSGILTGGNYAGFISEISKKGYEATLRDYGLANCIGKSSEEVLVIIADKIAPIGSTNDDAIARNAVLVALDTLYEKLLEEGKDIALLGSLDVQTLKESIQEYVSTYIFKKWVYEVGLAVEKNNLSEKDAIALEKEIKIFVRDEVKLALKDKDIIKLNLSDGEGKKMIENILLLAYSTIEK